MMRTITACRACGRPGLETLLHLGIVPLANALLDQPDQDEPRFPLTLALCPHCSLVQILETVDPRVLFSHYLYFSSFSDTMLAHARAEAEMLIDRCGLGRRSLVVEVASNDGYLLRNFIARNIPVLGIEPAANVARAAEAAGVPTRCAFFGRELADQLRGEGRRADVLIGNNVLAHIADLDGFVDGIARLLAPNGCAVFEVPYVREMIDGTEFDTIYHEHLCYYSLHALSVLFERRGLRITDVHRLDIHGGSLRVFAEPAAVAAPARAVATLLAEESACGLTDAAYYRDFVRRVEQLRDDLRAELERRKAAGQRLAAYGASAKGSTLMSYAGIDDRHLDYIVDRSTVKQGRFAPGNRLAILQPEALAERRPDAVLLLTWNFADEIVRQQRAYLDTGGVFIVPVPHVRTIGKEVPV
jgi:SAM-dependent methyltransferase